MTGTRPLELTAVQARWLLRAALAGVTAGIRNGGRVPPFAADVLRNLAAAADADAPAWLTAGSDSGTAPGNVGHVTDMVPTASAAAQVGVSDSYVRRLARTGRIRHHRAGRAWFVDVESLRSVLRRTAA